MKLGQHVDRHRWHSLLSFTPIAFIGCLFLVALPPWLSSSWILQAALDGLHVPAFAVITASTVRVLSPPDPSKCRPRTLVLAAFLSSIATLLVEVAQVPAGRSASWSDVKLGLAGVAVTTGFLWPFPPGVRTHIKVLFLLAGVIWQVLPFVHVLSVRHDLKRQLPALGHDPNFGWSRCWHPHPGSAVFRDGSRLRVELGPVQYGGVSFWANGQDWSQCMALELELFNPGPAMTLGLRIDDTDSGTAHDNRFNGELHLPTGISRHLIPLSKIEAGPKGRPLNLCSILRLVLFSPAAQTPQSFCLQTAILR